MDESLEKFYTPYSFLLKADKEDPYVIYLEASDEVADSQDDVVFQKALIDQRDNFLKKGVISWDHLHKVNKDPSFIIGEPLEVRFEEKDTWVKARLYKTVDYAKHIVNLLKDGCSRLGASIGGYIKRREAIGKSMWAILSIIWDELAITYKPVNDRTLGNVSLIPIGAFVKALMAGSGVDAGSFEGGRAMIKESLQGSAVKVDDLMKEFAWRLSLGDIKTDDDVKDFLDYQGVPQLYGILGKVLISKFKGRQN